MTTNEKHTLEVVCGDGSTVLGYGRNYDLEAFEAYRYGNAGQASEARTAASPDAVGLELYRQLSGQQLAQKSAEADGLRRTALALRSEVKRLREALAQAVRYVEVQHAYRGAMTAAEVEAAIIANASVSEVRIGANSCNTLAAFDLFKARAALGAAE